MKVTVKGQITVPLALRKRFGLEPGVEVEFLPREDGLQIRAGKRGRKPAKPFDQWLAKAAGSSTAGLRTDEILKWTRGGD